MAAPTLREALARLGISEADVARREKQRVLTRDRDRVLRAYPARTDWRIAPESRYEHRDRVGQVFTPGERARWERHGAFSGMQPVKDAETARHEQRLLDQCPDGRTRTAMYVGMYERQNRLVPAPVVFPDPCNAGGDAPVDPLAMDVTDEDNVAAAVRHLQWATA